MTEPVIVYRTAVLSTFRRNPRLRGSFAEAIGETIPLDRFRVDLSTSPGITDQGSLPLWSPRHFQSGPGGQIDYRNNLNKIRSMSRESTTNAAGLLKEIAAGKLRPLYLLFGSDPVIADEVLSALREKVISPGLEPFDLEVVHATDIDSDWLNLADLLQHMRQPPFGSLKRLIIIRDLDLLDKRRGRDLCAGMANLPDSSVVAVTCEYDRAWQTIFRETGIAGSVFATGSPAGDVLAQMVKRWAAASKLRLEEGAITQMIELVGEEPALLKGEVEKLATLFDAGTRVTAEDIRRLVSHTRVYALGEYVDHVVSHQTSQALTVLHRLAEWGEEPIKIIGWLAHRLLQHVRNLSGLEQEHLNRALYQLYLINRSILKGHPDPFVLLDIWTVCCCCRQPCRLASLKPRPEFCLSPVRPTVSGVKRHA